MQVIRDEPEAAGFHVGDEVRAWRDEREAEYVEVVVGEHGK